MEHTQVTLLRPFLHRKGGFVLSNNGETLIGQFSDLFVGDPLALDCLWNRRVSISPTGFTPTDKTWEAGGRIEIDEWNIVTHSENRIVINGKNGEQLSLYT